MTPSGVLLILAVALLIGAIVFVGIPGSKDKKTGKEYFTEAQQAVMYKTAYWLFMGEFGVLGLWFLLVLLRLA